MLILIVWNNCKKVRVKSGHPVWTYYCFKIAVRFTYHPLTLPQFEKIGDIPQAIHFFTKAGKSTYAAQLAMKNGVDKELLSLSLQVDFSKPLSRRTQDSLVRVKCTWGWAQNPYMFVNMVWFLLHTRSWNVRSVWIAFVIHLTNWNRAPRRWCFYQQDTSRRKEWVKSLRYFIKRWEDLIPFL